MDKDCEKFQCEITRERVIQMWKNIRESGMLQDGGRVSKEFFKRIIVKHFPFCKEKEILVDYIFERFKSDKIDTLNSARDDIEL